MLIGCCGKLLVEQGCWGEALRQGYWQRSLAEVGGQVCWPGLLKAATHRPRPALLSTQLNPTQLNPTPPTNPTAILLCACRYDLTVGTSERGSVTVDSPEFALPKYRHLLVVFGGVQVSWSVRIICLSVCLSACLSVCLFICLPVWFVSLSVCLSVWSACLYVCLSACLSACLSVCLPVCLSVCLYRCLFVLSVCLSNFLSCFLHVLSVSLSAAFFRRGHSHAAYTLKGGI